MEPNYIDKTKAFITSHLRAEFSLSELAQFVGYSAYHLAREFKNATGLSIMEYVREERVYAASKEIANGIGICDVAMGYCFDTHAGFTKAFVTIMGCTPKQYAEHANKMTRGVVVMSDSKIVIRHICKDDVQDLWENVYSAMTPRQITEDKILPAIEACKKQEGLELAAQVDGKVVMTLPMRKPFWIPVGFLFDNNYTSVDGDEDKIMRKMLDEMKRVAKMMGVTTLIAPEYENSKSVEAFLALGFTKAFTSGGWDYLMMEI